MTMGELFKKFGIEESSLDFLGHAVALHHNDNFMFEPVIDTVMKMQLYQESQGRYGDSPFLYPIYGIGGLPEAFSRLCAIHGGTYMLNTQVDELLMERERELSIDSAREAVTDVRIQSRIHTL